MHKYFWLLFLLLPRLVFADATAGNSVKADLPGIPPTPQYTIAGFDVNGYLEGSYNYLSQSQFFTSGVYDRLYDLNPNGFTLQQAAVVIAKQPTQGFGGLLNVIMGSDANQTPAYGMDPWFDSQNLGLEVVQLYAQYAVNSFIFMGGKYYALAGYETNQSPQNASFSSSFISSFAQPTAFTGVRAAYAVNDKLNLEVGVNDGWDNIRDWGLRNTVEVGAVYTTPIYLFSAYWYNGEERSAEVFPVTNVGPTGIRNLVDLIASMNVTNKLTLAANYDFASQNRALLPDGDYGRAVWQGIAAYLEYQINPTWRVALRGEYFNDHDGFATGVPQSLKEVTLTVGYLVFKHFEVRAETRRDLSNTDSILAKNGVTTSNNMQSFALEGIFTF